MAIAVAVAIAAAAATVAAVKAARVLPRRGSVRGYRVLFAYGAPLTAVVILSLAGCCCGGYHIGTQGLYNRDIQTVFVPMVEADTYRHGIGERLTEAICKKVTQQTPYTLAGPEDADSRLIVRLLAENQAVSGLDRYGETRQKTLSWSVSAIWIDRDRARVAELQQTPLTSLGIDIASQEYLVAETGQSFATASQEIIDKIAERVVGMMEVPW